MSVNFEKLKKHKSNNDKFSFSEIPKFKYMIEDMYELVYLKFIGKARDLLIYHFLIRGYNVLILK